MIAQMLTALGRKLYYYSRYSEEKHRNDVEVDFLLSNGSGTGFRVFPIEVKSSKSYSAVSLVRFGGLCPKRIAGPFIVHPKPPVREGGSPGYPRTWCSARSGGRGSRSRISASAFTSWISRLFRACWLTALNDSLGILPFLSE